MKIKRLVFALTLIIVFAFSSVMVYASSDVPAGFEETASAEGGAAVTAEDATEEAAAAPEQPVVEEETTEAEEPALEEVAEPETEAATEESTEAIEEETETEAAEEVVEEATEPEKTDEAVTEETTVAEETTAAEETIEETEEAAAPALKGKKVSAQENGVITEIDVANLPEEIMNGGTKVIESAIPTTKGDTQYAERNREAFNAAFEYARVNATDEQPITINVPTANGTYYYISNILFMYSNTNLVVDDAVTIVGMAEGSILKGSHYDNETDPHHCDADSANPTMTCKVYGYDQIHDVSITGGTWVAASAEDPSKNTQCIMFRHGTNINISNLTVNGATNHMMNISGVDGATIDNVTFENQVLYKGTDQSFWTGYEDKKDARRFQSLEALHLDFTSASGELGDGVHDNTPCKNISVTNCTFDGVFSGVGTHHDNEDTTKWAENISVTGCTFTNLHNNHEKSPSEDERYGIVFNYHQVNGVTFSNNMVNGAYDAALIANATGAVIENNTVSNIHRNGFLLTEGATATSISGNTISGTCVNAGVYIQNASSATVNDNTIEGTAVFGISVDDASSLTATGNTIKNSTNYGIYVKALSTAELTDNIISNPGDRGVSLNGANSLSISGGSISGTADSGIYANAPGATISVSGVTFGNIAKFAVGAYSPDGNTTSVTVNSITASSPIFVKDSTKAVVTGCNLSNVKLENNDTAIFLDNVGTAEVKNNTVTKPASAALRLKGVKNGTVSNNEFTSSGNYGALLYGASTATFSNNKINGSVEHAVVVNEGSKLTASSETYKNSQMNGIAVLGGSTLISSSNTIEGSGKHGIYAKESSTVTSTSDKILNVKEHGICVDKSKLTSKTNTITKPGKNGIALVNGANATVTNNTITEPGEVGVYSGGGAALTVTGGTISSPTGHGIYVADATGATKISGVTISNGKSSGMIIKNVKNASITNSTVDTVTGGNGLHLETIGNLTLTGTTVKKASNQGIKFMDIAAGSISKNTVQGNTNMGMWFTTSANGKNAASVTANLSTGNKYDYVIEGNSTNMPFKNNKYGEGNMYFKCTWNAKYADHNIHYQQTNALITSVVNVVAGSKINWKTSANTHVTGYMVFRQEPGQNGFTRIADINGRNVGTFTDTGKSDTGKVIGIKSGTTYTYLVTTKNKHQYNTAATNAAKKNSKFLAAPKLTGIVNTVNGPKITWGKVNGAVNYRVYKMTANGYKTIGTTTETSFIDNGKVIGINSGTTYKYMVRCTTADGKTQVSSYYAAGKSIKYVATPKLTSIANTKTGPKITWGKITGAVKYQVFRKTGNGGYAKIGSPTTALTYIDKTAKAGTTYTYMVRCCTADGKIMQSSYYSAGKTIKCSK